MRHLLVTAGLGLTAIVGGLALSCRDHAAVRGDAAAGSSGAVTAVASTATADAAPPSASSSAHRAGRAGAHPSEAPAFRRADVPVLRSPAEPACTFAAADFRPPRRRPVALHLHGKAPPYAYLRGGAVRLLIPPGAGRDAVVELDRGALVLYGLVRSDGPDERLPLARRPVSRRPFVLRPRRALLLARVVAVTGRTLIGWRAARPGRLAVTLPDTPVRFDRGTVVEIACRDLGLEPATFDHRPLLPPVPDGTAERRLMPGRPIRIAPGADEPSVASLRLLGDEPRFVELERTERRVRVRLERPDVAIFGWVRRRHLVGDEPLPLLGAGSLGLDGLGDTGLAAVPLSREVAVEYRCPTEVAIIADMTGRAPNPDVHAVNYAVVGRLSKRRPFRVRCGAGPLCELVLQQPLQGLSLARSRLAVAATDLEPCQPGGAP